MYGDYELAHAIFNHLEAFYPTYDADTLDWKEVLRTKPFSGTPKKKIQNELSRMYKWLKDFLVWKKMTGEEFCYEREKLEVEVLKERKLFIELQKAIIGTEATIEKSKQCVQNSFQLMELAWKNYYETEGEKLRSNADDLIKSQNELTQGFVAMQYKIGCELLARQYVLQEDNSQIIEKIKSLVRKNTCTGILAEAYFNVFETLSSLDATDKDTDSRATFNKARKFIEINIEKIDKAELIILVGQLFTFLINAQKLGVLDTLKDIFSLTKLGVDSKILIDDIIPHTSFINYVHIACRAGEVKWAENFVTKYVDKVEEEYREDVKNLAIATILFERKDWGNVLDQLTHINERNLDFGIRARWLRLATYYEHPKYRNDLNHFLDFCTAFRQFLRRQKKLNKRTLEGSKNLISIVEKMVKGQYADKNELHEAITTTNPLFFQQWLLDKAKTYRK